jgi:hypothetical protein
MDWPCMSACARSAQTCEGRNNPPSPQPLCLPHPESFSVAGASKSALERPARPGGGPRTCPNVILNCFPRKLAFPIFYLVSWTVMTAIVPPSAERGLFALYHGCAYPSRFGRTVRTGAPADDFSVGQAYGIGTDQGAVVRPGSAALQVH